MHIQLLVFDGCPLAAPARENLKKALSICEIENFDEIDILDAASPEDLQGWGSPTILINGEDITGYPKGGGVCCRVYETGDGAPDIQTIVNCIQLHR
ncbi:MAG: hypothetical protein KTR32_43660 [Granulosicoccus sp.]|nr:hypothetical protein [Granulosicoccus sp.]